MDVMIRVSDKYTYSDFNYQAEAYDIHLLPIANRHPSGNIDIGKCTPAKTVLMYETVVMNKDGYARPKQFMFDVSITKVYDYDTMFPIDISNFCEKVESYEIVRIKATLVKRVINVDGLKTKTRYKPVVNEMYLRQK